jgi:hypothetical protein
MDVRIVPNGLFSAEYILNVTIYSTWCYYQENQDGLLHHSQNLRHL